MFIQHCFITGDYAKAIEEGTSIVEDDPFDILTMRLVANAALLLGDLETAEEYFGRLCKFASYGENPRFYHALCLAANGSGKLAKSELEYYNTTQPGDGRVEILQEHIDKLSFENGEFKIRQNDLYVSLRGRVTSDFDGTAIIGATINIYDHGVLVASQQTDSNGTYSIRVLQHGEYYLTINKEGYETLAMDRKVSQSTGEMKIVLTTSLNYKLIGVVLDASNSKVIPGVLAIVNNTCMNGINYTFSNEKGLFNFFVNPSCASKLMVHADGYESREFKISDIRQIETDITSVSIKLQPN